MSTQNQSPRRVVVTGVGAVTALGPTAADLWEGAVAGRVAITEVEHWPMDGYRTRLGGEVKDMTPPEHDYPRPSDYRDPVMDFAMRAAEEAYAASGVTPEIVAPERFGAVVGTCNAGLITAAKWFADRRAGESPDPALLALVTPQALAETLSSAFDIKGPVLSVNTACAAGANAIGYAAELVRTGQADAVLTGGSDALSDVLFAGFNSLESLSPEPAAPYSKDRQGLSLGEGSGMLVLVREDIAREAGLPILAEVMSYGLSADGYHATAPLPDGTGAARAIKAALAAAGIQAEDVRYVNSHGTGTAKNDPAETNATKVGLGDAARSVAVSSTKSMIGHLLGAAGAVENIVTVEALNHQVVPPTANFTEPDPECDLDYTPNVARPLEMDVAMSNNFAFGGANAVVIHARPGTQEAPPAPALDRIVVTGLAALTPAGAQLDDAWSAFAEGRAVVGDEGGAAIGRADFDITEFMTRKETRRMDRLGVFSVIASKLALGDAALELTDDNRARVGAIVGSGVGPMESMENFSIPVLDEGAGAANPAVFPNTVYNAAGGQVAMHVGAVGPASTVTTGHAAGASAVCYCYDLAASNQADAMLAVATDTITDTVVDAFRDLGLVAPSIPKPGSSSGFALSEAGVAIVVERLSAAQARGASIYGEILGYGITFDGRKDGRIDTDGGGLERAMQLALDRAGVKAADVAAVWASACGHSVADGAERAAISRVFGRDDLVVLTPKFLFGEPLGAGGALSVALALTGWRRGDAEHSPTGPVVVNSMSLGGTNISIVLAPVA